MPRMSEHKTTKTEDTADCLIGIFEIHMPLIYGEGEATVIRPQEVIYEVSIGLLKTVTIDASGVDKISEVDGVLALSLKLTRVSPSSMWNEQQGIFITFSHHKPVGCASYSLAVGDDFLFIILFVIPHRCKPWLCLEGNGFNHLSPLPIE